MLQTTSNCSYALREHTDYVYSEKIKADHGEKKIKRQSQVNNCQYIKYTCITEKCSFQRIGRVQ